jgi:mannose-1-phosphate guanylyltransferase
MDHSYAIIMAGGAGTRLWPISRQKRPKQFQAFTHELTMLQHMVRLTTQVIPIERLFVMATPEFAAIIRGQIPQLPAENLLYEPSRRDNGPAITLGMIQVLKRDSKAVVALLWSDHDIRQETVFADTIKAAFKAAKEYPRALVTVGAKPTHPDPTLGYIQTGTEIATYDGVPIFKVKRFVEKPSPEDAARFVSSWEYLWNVGYKIVSAAFYLQKFNEVQPELAPTVNSLVAACAAKDEEKMADLYATFPKLSIEFLFTPFLTELLVVPADIGWSDIGNWKTLHDVLKDRHADQLVTRGEVLSLDSKDSLVFAGERPIAVIGIKDLIVVDDGDVILVMNKGCATDIKKFIQQLETSNPDLL